MERVNFPVWTQIDPVPRQYPWLSEDILCDVCVVGGGITGAMCALRIAQSGRSVVLAAKSQIGYGATAGSMPCVEYDCGQTIRGLAKYSSAELAEAYMHIAAQSIDELERLSTDLMGDFGFARRDSVLYTDDDSMIDMLGREYLARKKAGFDCVYINRPAARDVFSFDISGAIISKGLAAELDPYKLTHLCAEQASQAGARIFENTKVIRIDWDKDGCILLTSTCRRIRADKVVVAAGSACADILDGLIMPRTCFMAAGAPMPHLHDWPGRCVLRSFGSPDVTCSSSPDGRIFISGLETSVVDEHSRLGGILPIPALHRRRFEELEFYARHFFPSAGDIYFRYRTAARHCRTRDMLPIIGTSRNNPGCVFAVCCGSGGVLLSEYASRAVTDIIEHGGSEAEELFSPDRRSLR